MQRVLSFPSSRGSDSREFISKRMCFAFMFSLGFLAFLGGFLLGRFVFDKELELSRIKYKEHCNKGNKEEVVAVKEKFRASGIVDSISESSIEDYIRLLTSQHENSSSKNFLEASIFQKHLQDHGFDYVSPLVETTTELSFPSATRSSKAEIVDGEGDVILEFNDIREKYLGSEEGLTARVVEGEIVYVNFGLQADYHQLDLMNIPCKGKIVLIRGGNIPIGEIVSHAAERGVEGILLFLDAEQNDVDQPLLSPVELAKLQRNIKKWEKGIPVLELSTKDVIKIFDKMRQVSYTPKTWMGKLDTSYPIGPGFTDRSLSMKMTINTVNVVEASYNALGAIRGSKEPDRFVMITNEKGLTNNEEKPASILMELVRVLGDLKSTGWRPYRSIIVAFWGLEGPSLHLSSHPDNAIELLARKTVAYFKINSFDESGNATLAKVAPILENLFYESAQNAPVQNASADIMPSLAGDNSLIRCGVPFLTVNHVNAKNIKDVASFWGKAIWQLVESSKLPFGLGRYAKLLSHSISTIQGKFDKIAKSHSVSLDSFYHSVNQLIDAIKSFEEKWTRGRATDSVEMRIMTDQMLDFSRFLLYDGDPTSFSYHRYDHIILTKTGSDDSTAFGALQEFLEELSSRRKNTAIGDLKKRVISHLATLVETINLARDALTDGLESFISGNV